MDVEGVTPPRVAILTTLFDEHDTVARTILNTTGHPAVIGYAWAHSGGPGAAVPGWVAKTYKPGFYLPLSDLSKQYDRYELPARAIARNYATLFGTLRQEVKKGKLLRPDYVVALTGDTLLHNLSGIHWIIGQMEARPGVVLGVSKAVGGEFHRADRTPDQIKCGMGGGRSQHMACSDFMPQLFVVNYDFVEVGGFCDIPVTNRWTSEQCLGDAAVWSNRKPAGQYVFSELAYGFRQGVEYHVR